MGGWTIKDMPDQTGRIFVITGASGGIGLEAARALAWRGADLVFGVRDRMRGELAAREIRAAVPGTQIEVIELQLASLASVRAFASRTDALVPHIDGLLNNAGLAVPAIRAETANGFELQFGVNHLAHFALTGLLIPALLRAPAPRVVSISSGLHRNGRINFDDPQSLARYRPVAAYAASKLANLLFIQTLNRLATEQGSTLIAAAASPGVAATGILKSEGAAASLARLMPLLVKLFGQNAEQGALPGLFAATMPEVRGGDYWAPAGWRQMRGPPTLTKPAPAALDEMAGEQLWALSETLTGVFYPPLVPPTEDDA